MTETYSAPPVADDIDDADDRLSRVLDQEADRLLAQADGGAGASGGMAASGSLRQAVRDDLGAGREWAVGRGERVAEVIREEPLRATFYALGVGVLIGLLLRR